MTSTCRSARCSYYTMKEHIEQVDGSWYNYTHLCTTCGMGIHHTTWEAALLKTMDDLLAYLKLDSWQDFVDWVCDYTDDLTRVDFEAGTPEDPRQELTTYGDDYGQTIQFPTTVREVMSDLQSAEDNSRQDWRSFTGEAARRLVPLSAFYGGDLDPEQDKMPDDWVRNHDGTWRPRRTVRRP